MRPLPLLMALALALSPALSAAAAEPIRSIQYEFPADGARTLSWKTGSGDFTFGAWEEPSVLAEVRIRCAGTDEEACRKEAEGIQIEWLQKGDRIELGVGSLAGSAPPPAPSFALEGRLRVPATLRLEVAVESGGVAVSGLRGDVAVELGTGDASLQLSRRRAGAVDLEVTEGTAELLLNGRPVKGSGVLRNLHWQGEGKAAIQVKVGTGNARVRLEDGGPLEPGGGDH